MPDDKLRGYVFTHILDCLADPRNVRVVVEADLRQFPEPGGAAGGTSNDPADAHGQPVLSLSTRTN